MSRKKIRLTPETETEEKNLEPEPEPEEKESAGAAQPEEKPAEPEKQEEIPETVTLTAKEFSEVKDHIAALQKEKDETVALLQRNKADFDNYRRRNASIRLDSYEEGIRDCIKALLPALDNLDRATASEAVRDEHWCEGVELAIRQLHELLGKQGLAPIEEDKVFDPNLHDAVMQEKVDGRESGEILMVLQKGYRVKDKIIRHTMVKVAE